VTDVDQKENQDTDHIKHALKTAFEHIEDLYVGSRKINYRVMTGVNALDRITNGFHNGDLVAVCGAPGVGKSAFALSLACGSATRYKDRASVMMFSTQSTASQLAFRSIIAGARGTQSNIPQGHIKNADWPRLCFSAGHLSDLSLALNDIAATLDEIVIYGRERKREHGDTCLLILDSLDSITGEDRASYSEGLVRLKQLARELSVPIIVTSSVKPKERFRRFAAPDPLYTLLEKYSDVLMRITRRDVSENNNLKKLIVKKHTVQKWNMDVSVLKNKNGPVGDFHLDFLPQLSRFIGV
jgi:replicative DNA helicase